MRQFLIALVVGLCLAVVFASLAGCQKATFYEEYSKTPVRTTSVGPGSSTTQAYKVENAVYLWSSGQWYRLVDGRWVPLAAKKEEAPVCVPRR